MKQNLKIVQLLRDPRAMLRSRSGFKETFYNDLNWKVGESYNKLGLEAYDECRMFREDLKFGRTHLMGQYMYIDHNKISLEPNLWMNKIYNFVQLIVPHQVTDWINGVNDEKEESFKNEIQVSLDTHKNSSEIIYKWYKGFLITKLKNIDTQCSDLIKKLNWGFAVDAERYPLSFDISKY